MLSEALRQPVPDGVCGGLCPVGSPDLDEDMRDVGGDGPKAAAESLAYLVVGLASSDELEHSELSLCQIMGIFRGPFGVGLELLLQGNNPLLKCVHTELAGERQCLIQ